MFVVYGILDTDGSYFYVGKGKKQRLSATLSAKNNNPLKKNKINSIKKLTKRNPEVKIICIGSEEYCFDIEKKLIKKLGKKINGTGKLCNVSDGGEGTTGVIFSKERKEQLSKFLKENNPMNNPDSREKVRLSKLGINNPMYGKNFTKEHRTKIGLAHSGDKHWCYKKNRSKKTKEKISLSLKGKVPISAHLPKSNDHKQKISRSKCKNTYKLISPENKEYIVSSIPIFCRKQSLNSGRIYQVIKGNEKSHKGWKAVLL